MAGYSKTPLAKKLGIKAEFRIRIHGAPASYKKLLGKLPPGVVISTRLRTDIDLWHLFTRSESELDKRLPDCIDQIKRHAMVWVSWPKKSSGVPSTVTEDTIRKVALPLGLVDVKVCAVDDTWSGLKLVIRKELR